MVHINLSIHPTEEAEIHLEQISDAGLYCLRFDSNANIFLPRWRLVELHRLVGEYLNDLNDGGGEDNSERITELNWNHAQWVAPEAYHTPELGTCYQCAGKDFAPDCLDGDPHFLDDGLFWASDLYAAALVNETFRVEATGYFCGDCLTGMGFSVEGRPTLQEWVAPEDQGCNHSLDEMLDPTGRRQLVPYPTGEHQIYEACQ